jgi:dihydrofolate reductase
MLSIIVAMDINSGIGVNNQLLCHLPNDLKNFKELTTGNKVIMGRKTYESLPEKFRPLPNRENIVISRTQTEIPGCTVLSSIGELVMHITPPRLRSYIIDDRQNFIIGGGEIYKEVLPLTHKLYITRIYHIFEEADVFSPELDPSEWELQSSARYKKDEKHEYDYSFEVYIRVQS